MIRVEPSDDLLQQRIESIGVQSDTRSMAKYESRRRPKSNAPDHRGTEVTLERFVATERTSGWSLVELHSGARFGKACENCSHVFFAKPVVAGVMGSQCYKVARSRLRKERLRDNMVTCIRPRLSTDIAIFHLQ